MLGPQLDAMEMRERSAVLLMEVRGLFLSEARGARLVRAAIRDSQGDEFDTPARVPIGRPLVCGPWMAPVSR